MMIKDSTTQSSDLLSIVLPCLNESGNLAVTLRELKSCLESWNSGPWEIVVADNGSSDGSQEIALNEGVRCVQVSPGGYGAALRGGIEAARGEWIVFLDADHTYCVADLPELVKCTREVDAEMGIANRFGRPLPKGAMPWLHRYIGTPILSTLIRCLFGKGSSDCNSGFRCLKKSAFESWSVRSTGMEFASELLIKALLANARIVQIPSGLNPSSGHRDSKLSTWRDGMNHLLTILFHGPGFFERVGAIIIVLSLIGQVLCVAIGPVKMGAVEFFDVHSQILLFGGGFFGIQLYALGLHIHSISKNSNPLRLSRWVLTLQSAEMLALLLGLGALAIAGILFTIAYWINQGFHGIHISAVLLLYFELTLFPAILAVVLLSTRLLSQLSGNDTQIVVHEIPVPR